LRLLRRVQADAGNFRDAFETNELIIGLAEAEGDPLNIALASLARVLRLIDSNAPAGALGHLATLGARYRKLGSAEFDAGSEALHGMAY
ncbi:GGDEF domain-containing protein, partial [Acinetobacter baumannii]|nr:GGDEF domain-containing protein [Acinetobacter baumannii]